MGGRWAGAAVAGVLVLGGAVAGAAPASAVPAARTAGAVRTAPERAPQPRASEAAHRITESTLSVSKSRKRTVRHGSHGGFGGLFTWFGVVLLLCVLAVVLAVFWFRRRSRLRSQAG
ncbi:hypothetical protein ACGF0D_09140 [Kitasatospora sp. NPDC048298]|uniref:hypothetical protein n=1 Tax=Kitasatospora sp. NPDC048298 TaxID=3364049 RepID=UPI00371CC301